MQIWQIICMKYVNVKYKKIKAKIASKYLDIFLKYFHPPGMSLNILSLSHLDCDDVGLVQVEKNFHDKNNSLWLKDWK